MRFQRLLLLVLGFLLFVPKSLAHPLDISISTLYTSSHSHFIEASTYLHPFEVGYLLEEKNNFQVTGIDDVLQYKEDIFGYISDSIQFKNNGQLCEIISANIPPQDEIEIMGGGLEVQYEIKCPDTISLLEYSNTLFADDFELQTNKMLFFDEKDPIQTVYERVLTAKMTSDMFDFSHPEKNYHPEQDSDNDGLTDREENMYLTNSHLPDTDFDGYSDKEEVEGGYDPRNPEVSLGQIQRVPLETAKTERYYYQLEQGKDRQIEIKDSSAPLRADIQTASESEEEATFNMQKSAQDDHEEKVPEAKITVTTEEKNEHEIGGATLFKTEGLDRCLNRIKALFEDEDFLPKLLIFVFVFMLGILHAFEPGHGKSILISYLIDHDKHMKDALRFSASLTITHLLDVILLGLAFKLFSLMSDVSKYIGLVQKIGVYVLLVVSIFMLIRQFHPQKTLPHSPKKGVILGIIAGLAPCTIGWALMITIITLNQINWMIPIIIVFGAGIFTSMMTLSFIVLKLKKKLFSKSFGLMRLAPILSSLILFIIALILALRLN